MDYPLNETEAADLRSPARLEQLRQKSQSVSQRALLEGTPEALWPVFAFTDLLNQTVGMQETENTYLQRDYGGSWMHAETTNSGLAVAYEELPYEWLAPRKYRVERIHSKGPLKYLSFGLELQAQGLTQTEVTCTICFVSILPAAVARLLINKEISKFMQTFQLLSQQLAQGLPPLLAYFAPAQSAPQAETWVQQWRDFVPQEPIRRALADYIARAPERLAYRLRPFELAQAYGLDPLDTLKACLRLSREGLLHLLWDCRCPGCKGPKESFSHLSGIQSLAYCPSCAVSYGLAFDQNLELTFQPVSSLRPTTDRYFCAGSPGNTPHICWQQNLLPRQQLSCQLELPAGVYALRSLSSNNELILSLSEQPGALSELKLKLAQGFASESGSAEHLDLKPAVRLQLDNQNDYEVTLMLEDLSWQPLAVTAARVQALQAFHDLFPEEVLAPDEALPLTSQIFLQARILNPQQLDAEDQHASQDEILSWVQSRVQQHEGAALRQADSLLGIFATPFEALSAAWDLRQELASLHLLYASPIELGLALVQGPCEVFVESGRLSYRGLACELAEQALELSAGESIVVSESLLNGPEMQGFLQDPLLQIESLPGQDVEWLRLVFEPQADFSELLL